ncbi:hypothetical protein [Streptomyces sp. NPDC058653]|uniref:hypothetical protein n=1 Tax=Streptomyces sp. NPDC058653 TaxID=3346576 RepID=UPI0036644C9B
MTQSGQRDEPQSPAARPAHEGIVLPADGGPPLIPGAPPADQVAPAGGQPWGQPWGPGAAQPQPEPPQQDSGAYGSYEEPGAYGGGGGGYGYPQQARSPQQPQQPHQPQQPEQQYQPPQQQSYQQPPQPLPPAHPGPLPQALPPQQEPPGAYGTQGAGGYGAQPLPAEAPPGGAADATQYIPPVPAAGGPADATQYIPPVPPGGGPADATQYIPPVPQYQQGQNPGGLPPERPAESTQYLGAAQPGRPAQGTSEADATQFIAPVPVDPTDIPAVPPGAPYGIRPGAPGDRQPPAEFDSLFRTETPGGGGAVPDETQQLPHFDPAAAPPPGPRAGAGHGRRRAAPGQGQQGNSQQGHGQQGHGQGGAPPPYTQPGAPGDPSGPQGRAAGRRKSSPLPLIAAVVVGCAVLGLGAGWLMSGDDSEKQDKNQTVSSESSPSGPDGEAAGEDPAKPQAEELDKLLAESNDSRSAVISAVESIKGCKNLDQAVTDLKDAADQRRDLVSRLKEVTIDKLPQHGQLSNSLTDAWQASASADDHYATWAAEAKTKKGCKDGKARTTKAAAEGNRASGEATAAKQKASGLWNGIASKYGLTERAPTEL